VRRRRTSGTKQREDVPLEACYLGWQESLELLGKLVETEIAGE
jgi:hypothetical protein